MHINSKALWTTIAALGLTAGGLTSLAAQPPAGDVPQRPGVQRRGPGRGAGPGPGLMLRHLDLTEAQQQQIRALMQERRQDGRTPVQKRTELERELRTAIFADTPDTAKIESLKTAISEAAAAALSARIDLELRVAQVLTPEQRAKAREVRGPGGHRGGRGGSGSGQGR